MIPEGIKAVLFDFGGVLAEEGFREGLKEIARKNNLDPEEFYNFVTKYILQCGYLTGTTSESQFWQGLRSLKGIKGSDEQLRTEILKRFILRPRMLQIVKDLKHRNYRVGILSDQTNWLDELDRTYRFSHLFDHVFNSYHIHRSKHEVDLFRDVARWMGLSPSEVLFIDDNPDNVERAQQAGLVGIHFTDIQALMDTLRL